MLRRLSGAAGLAALLAGHALAQETTPQPAPQPEQGAGEVQVFEPGYFARYNANTVLDMVSQIPGFAIQEGDSVRGFGGSAGNVLINGERPSTKTGLGPLLQRTPASAVVRIELVTGQSAKLDMRGQTKVVNIILREGASATPQPINYDFMAKSTHDGRIQGQLLVSTQQDMFGGKINLSGVVNNVAGNGPAGGAFVEAGREKYNAAGVSTEHGIGFTEQQPYARVANFEYEGDLDWAKLRLNGGLTVVDMDVDRFFENYSPNAQGPRTSIERTRTRISETQYTLGGDLEHKFTSDISGKLITFHRRSASDVSSTFSTFTGAGALNGATTSAPEGESGESILRGQLNWKLGGGHSIEIAAETAYNFLDSITQFTLTTPTTSTTFFVDGSDTKVEEFRNEFQISDVWAVTLDLTIEPGFKFETSRIEQSVNYATQPDLRAEREFEYPKPSITATWRISPEQQLRVAYKRDVAQLSFTDFVSSVELVNSQTTGGNPDLVPERTWAFSSEFEQRFWKGGVLTLFANYDQVEDVQDFVPITTTAGIVDAPGNIGDGTRFLVGFRGTVPLENLGIKGARLDLSLSAGGSEVTDPVTGETREFSDEFKENWSLSYRHDLPEMKFSYGVRFNGGGPATAYRFNEASRRSRDDEDFGVWAETTAFFGVRIRAGVDDILAADFSRNRVIYTGLRGLTAISRVEQTHSSNGVQPYIRIAGKF